MPGKEALCLLACRVFFSLLVRLNSSTTSPLLHLIASLPLSYSFSLSSAFLHGSSSCFTPVLRHYLPLHPSPLCQVLFIFPLSTHFLLLFPCPLPPPHSASTRWLILWCELNDKCNTFTVVFCLFSDWISPSYSHKQCPPFSAESKSKQETVKQQQCWWKWASVCALSGPLIISPPPKPKVTLWGPQWHWPQSVLRWSSTCAG